MNLISGVWWAAMVGRVVVDCEGRPRMGEGTDWLGMGALVAVDVGAGLRGRARHSHDGGRFLKVSGVRGGLWGGGECGNA